MRVTLHFPKLDLHSGTAQLIRMQALGLRTAGARVRVVAERGAWRFFLATGIRTERASASALASRPRSADELIVDHGLSIANADFVFVHNLATAANRYLMRADRARADAEREFFARVGDGTPIVANSKLVQSALVADFSVPEERIVVNYPGYEQARFRADRRLALRARARRTLGVDTETRLVGFVTSGDFHKRGLDLFLLTAERIARASPEVRFLVVGARRLPSEAAQHPLVESGRLLYRPKNHHPERWIAALDLFVYAARYEEFGMVLLEALALGVPALTSRRVGAAECLPPAYGRWIAAEPDADWFAEASLRLLADDGARAALALAGIEHAPRYSDAEYARAAARTILRSDGSNTR
jgi:glycosyltransferase involved in cell wall biosynthesis